MRKVRRKKAVLTKNRRAEFESAHYPVADGVYGLCRATDTFKPRPPIYIGHRGLLYEVC